jgi:L-threonylcarbamoyladenylate synthase
MEGRIDGLIDGGSCHVGLESTVVRIDADQAVIYRPGAITQEQLEEVLHVPVRHDPHLASSDHAPQAPGMKYRHYAPRANVHVWLGSVEHVRAAMLAFSQAHPGDHVATISSVPWLNHPLSWAPLDARGYEQDLSRELYHLLRHFDRMGATHILIEGVSPHGLGNAIMNRLQKAANGRVIRL